MAIKLSVGLNKKVGLPDYGSLGASCHVEFEIDSSLLHQDLDGFHRKVNTAFSACRQAVDDELAKQSAPSVPSIGNGHSGTNSGRNGHAHSNGSGQRAKQEVGMATQGQVRAIFAIAKSQQVDPATLVRDRFNVKGPEDLSIREASKLIDELKRGAVEVRS